MYFYPALGIIITVYILFLIWLFRERPADLSVNDLRISKRQFVVAGLQWCQENLGTVRNTHQLKIYYYQNRKFGGKFQSHNKEIIIYIHPDLKLIELTDTIIHEYTHHIQFSKKSTEQDYNKNLLEVGYWENPYEVKARKIASQNRNECLKWILLNNRIT